MAMLPKYKDIMDLIKKGATLEAQEKIMELRETALAFQEENQELKEKLREMQERLEIQGKLVWEKPSYWLVDDDTRDGPYCQRCYDTEQSLIRLQGGNNDLWVCKSCQSKYYGPNYQPPKPRVVNRGGRFGGF